MKDPNDKVTLDIFDKEPTDTEILKWMGENVDSIERIAIDAPFYVVHVGHDVYLGTGLKDAVKEAMKCSN